MVAIVDRGGAILMISSDLPEVLNMSDRVYVMRNGALSDHVQRADATEQRLLAAMFPDLEEPPRRVGADVA
jgi:ABC-type sugar transport system ATPase subunit